jgi:hypothetical protein
MMDTTLLTALHAQLSIVKGIPAEKFGGVNIIFAGDFLQLPSVNHKDLYISSGTSGMQLAHSYWRSINAVVVLKQQMRQAEDPQYAEMLSRIRLRCPTDRDIELLNSRVGAPLPEGCVSPTSIVRRHNVRHCLNMERLKQMSALNGTPIMYCIGRIVEQSKDMTANTIFSIRYRDTNDFQDAVLALIPGAPLIVTVNTNSTIGLVNGAGVEFYGFSDSLGSLPTQVIRPPKYMLVRVLEGPGSEITLPCPRSRSN